MAHTVAFTVVVSNGKAVTVIVRIVSHPVVVLATVSVNVPAALNTLPSKVYGKLPAHTAMFTVVVNNGIVVTLIVLIVSQPVVVLATVSINDPGKLNICPSIVAGKLLAHTVAFTVVVSNGKAVIVIVRIVSHPVVVLATVSVNVPAVLNTLPSKV